MKFELYDDGWVVIGPGPSSFGLEKEIYHLGFFRTKEEAEMAMLQVMLATNVGKHILDHQLI